MPKIKIAKTPRFAEPHTVDIPDLESYTAMVEKPPYTHLRRVLPQYVVSMMLHRLHAEGKRYVRIYLPAECLAPAYLTNPPLFAKIIRQQKECPFQYVIARHEPQAGRVRITGSNNAPQKGNSYLATCGASLLGEYEKQGGKCDVTSFAMIFPYANMPTSYQNDQYVFRYRIEKWLQEKLEQPGLEVRCQLSGEGYRLTVIPTEPKKLS